jgi:TM2 domain-containing membrane protein YozV
MIISYADMRSNQVVLMAFCENCGANVNPGDQFCDSCGASLGAATMEQKFTQPEPAAPAKTPAAGQGEKNPVLAAILVCGLGQVYNGSFGKGILILFGTLIGYLIFVIPGIIVLVYGMYDAYMTAKKMNEGQVPFVPYQTTHIIAFVGIGIIVIFFYILVLAGLAMVMGEF